MGVVRGRTKWSIDLVGEISETIFSPMNAIDRHIRYDTWPYTNEELFRDLHLPEADGP